MNWLLAVVSVISAIAAMISAGLAYQSNRDTAKKERANRERELSLVANKVVAATTRVDDLANQLKVASSHSLNSPVTAHTVAAATR